MLTFNFGNRMPIKVAEICSIILCIWYILKYHNVSFYTHEKEIMIWLLMGFFSAVIATARYHFAIQEFIYGLLYPIRLILYIFTANIICKRVYKHTDKSDEFTEYILKMYCIVCVIGVLQLISFPTAYDFYSLFTRFGVYISTPDPHQGRLLSSYFDPNYLSGCLLIPFAIALNRWITENKKKRFLYYVVIYGVTIILTVSRSGILGMCIIILLSFFGNTMKRKTVTKIFLLALIVVVAIIFLITSNARIITRFVNVLSDKSALARLGSWERGINTVKNNLILGVGYNLIWAYSSHVSHLQVGLATGYGNDSSLLVILETTGLVGFVYFILINMRIVMRGFREKNKTIISQILLATLVISNFNNFLFYPLWFFPMTLLLDVISNEKAA